MDRRTDEWGRVILNPNRAFELAFEGIDVWSLPMDVSPEIEQFNAICKAFDTGVAILPPDQPTISPEEEHARRADTWMISDEVRAIPVREFLLSLCQTDIERERVSMEMDLFEERNLIPLLQLMIYLVDHFRQNGTVWGVGRGSSVASYCLYLIGVHRVDSIRYGLDVRDFLK